MDTEEKPKTPLIEIKEETPTSAIPSPAQTSKKDTPKKKKWWWLLILLLLLLLIGGGVYLWMSRDHSKPASKSAAQETGFAGPLKSVAPQLDEDYKVTRGIGTTGGIIMAESRNGTLYTLVIPADAMLVPKTITLAPLKSSSITNFQADGDPGVWIGPDGTGGLFNRPVYLIIQKNTKRPASGSIGQYGPCNTASRFFDPQWCATKNKAKFGFGVEADKAVVVSRFDLNSVIVAPTIPTGEDFYVAATTHGGSFAAAKINGTKAVQLAQATFGKRSAADDENNAEALAHVAAFDKDLSQFEEQIQWLTKAKRDPPQDLLKEAIVANQRGASDIAQNRIDQFFVIMNKNIANYDTAYLPTVDYEMLRAQIAYELTGSSTATTSSALSSDTKAKPAKKTPAKKTPPKGVQDLGKLPQQQLDDLQKNAPYFQKKISEAKACQVAATLEVGVLYKDFIDPQVVNDALNRGFTDCPQQRDRLANIADQYLNANFVDKVNKDRKQNQKLQSCNSDSIVHKQGLADYGMNECGGDEPAQAAS